MTQQAQPFRWGFQRLGGLDQVVLEDGESICRLGSLDPKLWVALSCPIAGLDFDGRTLALIDEDKDGRIRLPELVAAVEWTCARLGDPAVLVNPSPSLPVEAITTATDEGRRLAATGKAILQGLGKPDATNVSVEDVNHALRHAAEQMFNGDGILPPQAGFGEDVRRFIDDAVRVTGGISDASGQTGIDRGIADAFVDTLRAWRDWRNTTESVSLPLGPSTSEGWSLLEAVKDKLDDYFLRCELAAYAPQAENSLNVDEHFSLDGEHGSTDRSTLEALPLSRIGADRPLDLTSGLNPAWRDKMERFASMFRPLLSQEGRLSRADWLSIQEQFEPYSAALALKPSPPFVTVTTPPVAGVDSLGLDRINAILDSDVAGRFADLAEQDKAVPVTAADIAAMERLVLYYLHLHRLLLNFVSFTDFYSLKNATFQVGTLYIDGRSCSLCVPADKPDAHATLAALSHLYLLYCTCTRVSDNDGTPETMNIVAAVTAGDSDLLLENRHGIFVDGKGDDWDATVVKIVDNPIGLWQAIWLPYKRFGSMVSEQIGKFATSKQAELTATAGQKLGQMTTAATTVPPAAEPPKFDIGKNVGIFAAVGLALGALGTALASIAKALFALQWWQFPLVFLGIFALISGPSLVIAWLKLRQRTLGPLLEASGWAVNGRVFIKYSLATKLTAEAELPPGADRDRNDPLRSTRNRNLAILCLAALIGAAAVGAWLWFHPL